MNYNEQQKISSAAENRNPLLEQEIKAYLTQKLGNQNASVAQQQEMLRKMLLNNEQGNSLLKNYVNNVCDPIMKKNTKKDQRESSSLW